ncbi:hypothetical protein BDD12DRAFT_835567 [Trichophaea hybrida]|nr:hypothetical protein BDD12DRAFT_835567 [Trichophaea hybrida]
MPLLFPLPSSSVPKPSSSILNKMPTALTNIRKKFKNVYSPTSPQSVLIISAPTPPPPIRRGAGPRAPPTPGVSALLSALQNLRIAQHTLKTRLKLFINVFTPPPSSSSTSSSSGEDWDGGRGWWYAEDGVEKEPKEVLLEARQELYTLSDTHEELQGKFRALMETGDFLRTREQIKVVESEMARIWEAFRQLEQLEAVSWERVYVVNGL